MFPNLEKERKKLFHGTVREVLEWACMKNTSKILRKKIHSCLLYLFMDFLTDFQLLTINCGPEILHAEFQK